jgi:hypothetical protein
MEGFGEEMFEEMANKPEAQSFMPWSDEKSLQEFKKNEIEEAKKNEKPEITAKFDALEAEAEGHTFGDFSDMRLQGTKDLPDSMYAEGLGIEDQLPHELTKQMNEKMTTDIKEAFADFRKELKETLNEFRDEFKKMLEDYKDKK